MQNPNLSTHCNWPCVSRSQSPILRSYLHCLKIYKNDNRISDGFERQPHIHFLWYSRDYKVGTKGLLKFFLSSRKFSGMQHFYFIINFNKMHFVLAGPWNSCRRTDPYGCWEYLHQGEGRRIHQENFVLLSRLSPITVNVIKRTKDHIVLDLHMPYTQESLLMLEIQSQIQLLLNQQLKD